MEELRGVVSPQEIEDGIKSNKTVTWDPFTVLPKEMYLKIFDKIENYVDKQNFMNANLKWYDLLKSKRSVFLFEGVFKEVVKQDKNKVIKSWLVPEDEKQVFVDYKKCRLVCSAWDKGISCFFQLNDNHFKIGSGKGIWGRSVTFSRDKIEYKFLKKFTWLNGNDGENDLKIFSLTHPPWRNPFLSRSLTLLAFFDRYDPANDLGRYRASVDLILERYGKHIWHCTIIIRVVNKLKMDWEDWLCITNWLKLMPELKTLYLICEAVTDSDDDLKEIEDMEEIRPELENLVYVKI